jgi:cobalamin biosynthesis protein CobW
MNGPPVDIVCGFLGSGKTTLLRYVLEHGLEGRRVAVVMNEIGDVGIDGRVIEGLNVDKMVELSSGCICCTVNGQLGPAMEEILAQAQPEQIIIETTGVAEVPPIVAGLEAIDLAADAVITVVDAESFLTVEKREAVVARQVHAADFLVLNKTDLVDERRMKRLLRVLGRMNPDAEIFSTAWGRVQTDVLFGSGESVRIRPTSIADGYCHVEDGGASSFVFQSQRPLDRERFLKLVRRWPKDLYRCKGFTYFASEEHPRLFNYTCGRVHMEWLSAEERPTDQGTSLVFIGKNLAKARPRIITSLRSCETGAPQKQFACAAD